MKSPPTPTSHDQLQALCFQWHWNSYPEQRGLLHANNNNAQNKIKGNQNKAIGVTEGVADMEYLKNNTLHFIEIKWGSDTQSAAQKKFQRCVEAEGGKYYIVRSLEQFKTLISNINGEVF